FQDKPFAKDSKAYHSGKKFPAKPASGGGLGGMRGLAVGGVDFAGAQYKPKGDKLHVFTAIDVTVKFGGDNKGKFGGASDIKSKWNTWYSKNYGALLDNYGTVTANIDPGNLPQFCGEEMLVITSPANSAAAETFRAAKQAQGYFARVKLTGSGAGQIGTTKEEIQAYIRGELNANCSVRPQYVVLLGNTDAVPTFILPCNSASDIAKCDVATDLPYSLDGNGSDLFADVMLGRIPAPDLDSANAVVSKMVGYETSAPSNDVDFYTHTTVTGFFEQRYVCLLNEGESGAPNCKEANGPVTGHLEPDYTNHKDGRGFTKTAESIRTAMVNAGLDVDRVYTKGDDPQVIPEQYYDGTPIPDYLRLPAFPWDGDGNDLLDHYNDGRSLILHRDHGYNYGWLHPFLGNINVFQLNNGTRLPVVFGVDCASATFDLPGSPSFVEAQVMKPDGGAFAGFGDTQVSPTWPNNHMAYGFFDAMFPDTQPNFGSDVATTRLGDILLSGKNYMASQNSGAAEYQEHYLYHLLGDPSAQAWVSTPVDIDVSKIDVVLVPITTPGGPPFRVHVDMGDQGIETPTVVTLYHQGNVVGRGVVTKGTVDITPEAPVGRSELVTAFEQDRALPAQKAVALR
ncbi:MAG TPA: C25 family cysteine peptidase, partial [Thermoleophilaceae bacterium]|nr:C25 family cysteine peptidase [Thermoleophilaceae bacterium]